MMLLALSVLTPGLIVGGPRLAAPTPALRARSSSPRCGFEVETLSSNDVLEMNVMNWPGLEKRTSDFEQSATEDEVKMVYVKDGEAVVSDAEETTTVGPGSLIMIQGGDTKWGVTAEGGITLISLTTSTDEVTGDGVLEGQEPEPVQDLTLQEAAKLLGFGLVFGLTLSVVTTLVQTM